MEQVTAKVDQLLQPLTRSPWNAVLTLAIVLYAGLASQPLPAPVRGLFNNTLFRVLIMFLILWIGNHDPALSIVVAVAFVLTLTLASGMENFEGPQTYARQGCLNIKLYDLLAAYGGSKDDLITDMQRARVPLQFKLSDEYAPFIATILNDNLGKKFSETCQPPNGTKTSLS